jgi:hypothetical protein
MSMKKTVLTWGLISGAVSSGLMVAMLPLIDRIGFDKGTILGYTTLVLSALLIFFGVRSYRDNVAQGKVTFGRAFAVGLLIALVSSVCYVATWEVVYFNFAPDFGDKYAAHMVEKARASGASAEQIAKTTQEMADFKKLYDQPLANAALTFLEPFPFGLLAALVSATILRQRRTATS